MMLRGRFQRYLSLMRESDWQPEEFCLTVPKSPVSCSLDRPSPLQHTRAYVAG